MSFIISRNGHGFKKISLTEKYDMGVDIIAEKDGQRWGIQTKRYNHPVTVDAVRQVVSGLNTYSWDKAMVITNSTFNDYTIKHARSNHCVLIDRIERAKLINKAAQA
jgi:HJR/Mrr/RecB family endonuclease